MAKKGTPRNQPNVNVQPPKDQPISRQQLDGSVAIMVTRLRDLAGSIDIVVQGYNKFIREQKLPKEDKKVEV